MSSMSSKLPVLETKKTSSDDLVESHLTKIGIEDVEDAIDIIEFILSQGINTDHPDPDGPSLFDEGMTALLLACSLMAKARVSLRLGLRLVAAQLLPEQLKGRENNETTKE